MSLKEPATDIGGPSAPERTIAALAGLLGALLAGLWVAERAGVLAGLATDAAAIGIVIAIALAAAIAAHGRRPVDFYVAGRGLPIRVGAVGIAASLAGLLLLANGGERSGSGALAVGLIAGIAVAAAVVAPYLRRFGGYSVGDFLAARFGPGARFLAAAIGLVSWGLILMAALKGAGTSLAVFALDVGRAEDLAIAFAAASVVCGGMRALAWSAVLPFFAVAAGCVAAFVAPSGPAGFGPPAEWFAGRGVLEIGAAALAAVSLASTTGWPLAARSGRQAGATLALGALVSGGIVATVLAGSAAGPAASPQLLFGPALVAAGSAAALLFLLTTALFAVVAIAAHDLYDEVLDRRGGSGRRVLVARLLTVLLALAAGRATAATDLSAAELMRLGMALAAAGLALPLALALHWRRCNGWGAVAGMATGLACALGGWAAGWPFAGETFALATAGAGVAAIAAVGMSLLTPAPSAVSQEIVDAVRRETTIARERAA